MAAFRKMQNEEMLTVRELTGMRAGSYKRLNSEDLIKSLRRSITASQNERHCVVTCTVPLCVEL